MPDQPLTPAVIAAVADATTPAQVEVAIGLPAVTAAAVARATPAQITAAVERVPWYRSKGMLAAYTGLAIAVVDALSTVILGHDISWRTAALALFSSLAAWARMSATTIVKSWLGLEGPTP